MRAEARRRGMNAADLTRSFRFRSACKPSKAIRIRAISIMQHQKSINRRERSPCAASCRTRTACCCRAISCGFACPSSEQQNALLVPDTSLGSDQSGRYVLVVTKGQHHRTAQGADRASSKARLRVIKEGLKADDRVVVAGCCGPFPARRSTRRSRRSTSPKRTIPSPAIPKRRPNRPRHDLQILHRTAGPGPTSSRC